MPKSPPGPGGPPPPTQRRDLTTVGAPPPDLGATPLPELSRRPGRNKRKGGSVGAILAWVLLLCALIGAGAAWVWFVMPLQQQLARAQLSLSDASTTINTLQTQVASLTQSKRQLENASDRLAQTLEAREQDLQTLQQTQEELARKLSEEVERGNVAIHQSEGELVVDLVDQIVFNSGESQVNAQGKGLLRQVVESLTKVPDKVIEVRGHTDAVPIAPKLLKNFPTNWELSTERATNVVRFLQEECGVPGEHLVAAGYSQYRPTADNDSKLGRRRNRRIEIVLLPLHRQ